MVFLSGEHLSNLLRLFESNEEKCVDSAIAGDFEAAHSHGYKLYDKSPQYIIWTFYLDLAAKKNLLLLFLKKQLSIEPLFLYTLLKDERLAWDDLKDLIPDSFDESFVSKLLRREIILKKHGFVSAIPGLDGDVYDGKHKQVHVNRANLSQKERDGLFQEINGVISSLDDFKLYDFAIQNGIEVLPRKSTNYNWYKLIISRDKDLARTMILKTINFHEVALIAELSGLDITGHATYDILLEFLHGGYSECLLRRITDEFRGNKSFMTCKVFLALLIASRSESNLVLAHYISYAYPDKNNYEIELTHLFLSRYFCFYEGVRSLMGKLKIKTIQTYNMTYLWSDPMIASGASTSRHSKQLTLLLRKNREEARRKMKHYLDNGQLAQAASLHSIITKVDNMSCIKEVKSGVIYSADPSTLFSGLLGPECRYLFDKLIVGHRRTREGTISTLYTECASRADLSTFFNNPLWKIEDGKFIEHFTSLYNLRNSKKP